MEMAEKERAIRKVQRQEDRLNELRDFYGERFGHIAELIRYNGFWIERYWRRMRERKAEHGIEEWFEGASIED